jgi:hypothetical protein
MFPSDIDVVRALRTNIGLSSSSKTVYDETARDFLAEVISPSSENMVLLEYLTLFPDFRFCLFVASGVGSTCGIGGAPDNAISLAEEVVVRVVIDGASKCCSDRALFCPE